MQINQTVHGYDHGHRLLASSISLSRESEKVMSNLSDLSGLSVAPGFDNYISGYGLQEDGYYAYARTWYAPEMERPGCVWTHTLLIDNSDLMSIPSALSLNRLFRRPQGTNNSFREYENPITAYRSQFDNGLEMPRVDLSHLDHAQQTLQALYEENQTVVIVPAPDSLLYEWFVISLWSQQWPNLRATFNFCTGSLSLRFLNDRPFDLQIVPEKEERRILRSLQNMNPVNASIDKVVASDWAIALANDLSLSEGSHLRRKLWEYAADDVKSTRKTFGNLTKSIIDVEMFQNGALEIEQVLERIGTRFPDPAEARHLKLAAFGPNVFTAIPDRVPQELSMIRALLHSRFQNAYNASDLDLTGRVAHLWRSSSEGMSDIVVEASKVMGLDIAEAILNGVSEIITGGEISRLATETPNVVNALIARNPSLAADSEIWKLNDLILKQILRTLSHEHLPQRELRDIYSAILEASAMDIAKDAVDFLGSDSIPSLLSAVNDSLKKTGALSNAWSEALSDQEEAIIHWIVNEDDQIQKSTANLISRSLSVTSTVVQGSNSRTWLSILDHGSESPDSLDIETSAFVLALGFMRIDDDANKLIVASFDRVHRVLQNGRLGKRAIEQLKYSIKIKDGRLSQKTIAIKLQSGLVERFLTNIWSPELFFEALTTEGSLVPVLSSLRRPTHRRLRLRLFEYAGDKRSDIQIWQQNETRRLLKPSTWRYPF